MAVEDGVGITNGIGVGVTVGVVIGADTRFST
jgi:hypothetical protein